jgi:hypothetical protein
MTKTPAKMTAKTSQAVAKAVKKARFPGTGTIRLGYPKKKICSRGLKRCFSFSKFPTLRLFPAGPRGMIKPVVFQN